MSANDEPKGFECGQPPIFVPPESETRPEAAIPPLTLLKLEEIAETLYALGWSSPNDGQWDGLRKFVTDLEALHRIGVRAHVAAETAGLRALIVKKDEALLDSARRFEQIRKDCKDARWWLLEAQASGGRQAIEEVNGPLSLTPSDLSDCIVVKRSEWERLKNLDDMLTDP